MTILPVASRSRLRRECGELVSRHRRALTWTVLLHLAAALVSVVPPRILGDLVAAVGAGTTTSYVDRAVLVLLVVVLLQAALTRAARLSAYTLGERLLAQLREGFVGRVLALPLGVVERVTGGDLLNRSTGDIDRLTRSMQLAVPEVLVASVRVLVTVVAAFVVAPLVALPMLIAVPPLLVATRWYARRAPAGYQREMRAYAAITGTVADTAGGARTVDAMRLRDVRVQRTDDDLTEAYAAERYTLFLRSVWFPAVEATYVVPVVACLLIGGLLHIHGTATLAQVTTVALYAQQLVDPIDRLIMWTDELQLGGASLSRLLGAGEVADDRLVSGVRPDDERFDVDDVRYAYRAGHDVLHGVTLHLAPGERLAVVGPSGAGKSTLGRLLAGIHPPRAGRVTVGGADLVGLPLEELRREVALVTQEHHVFLGTIRDNVTLGRPDASDADVRRALEAVDADEWVAALPASLDTAVGEGSGGDDGLALTVAQAQQLALARIVLVDPHTLVLDEATSLLDPRSARHLERSLAAVVEGRTVVAIAHRLHTAHDADRVAVVEDGRISELGSHDELLDRGGSYAALWSAWTDTGAPA
ncbi:MAG TPA: ABC transporter ATP-binding protein [Mycobacteriales bacterium]|nr:ABC transporter ATP-binding protein [Mycobacteriales bacterium]